MPRTQRVAGEPAAHAPAYPRSPQDLSQFWPGTARVRYRGAAPRKSRSSVASTLTPKPGCVAKRVKDRSVASRATNNRDGITASNTSAPTWAERWRSADADVIVELDDDQPSAAASRWRALPLQCDHARRSDQTPAWCKQAVGTTGAGLLIGLHVEVMPITSAPKPSGSQRRQPRHDCNGTHAALTGNQRGAWAARRNVAPAPGCEDAGRPLLLQAFM